MAFFKIDTVGVNDESTEAGWDDDFAPLTTQYGPDDSEDEDEDVSNRQVLSSMDDGEGDEENEEIYIGGMYMIFHNENADALGHSSELQICRLHLLTYSMFSGTLFSAPRRFGRMKSIILAIRNQAIWKIFAKQWAGCG